MNNRINSKNILRVNSILYLYKSKLANMHDLAVTILKNAELEHEEAVKKHTDILNDIRASIALLLNPEKSIQLERPSLFSANGHGNEKKTRIKRAYDSSNRRNGLDIISKATDTIRKEGRFLHKREIEKISGLEKVSASLSVAKSKQREGLTSYKPGISINQTVWGFIDWLDSNGKPKPEHMFNEELVLAIK